MDEEGDMAIPVENGFHLKEDYVGEHLKNYDSVLVLSHFKGHAMAGFGGALKNISIEKKFKNFNNCIGCIDSINIDIIGR